MQAGRILGDSSIVIQDDSGGIPVRLPAAETRAPLERGAIVEVEGVLAAPYGNQELRPADWSDIVVLGAGGLPDPVVLDSAHIAEGTEGQLATTTGTVVKIDRRSSGALSMTIQDDRGEAIVYAHAELGLDRALFDRGDRIRATGIVGQRASRSGAADGHRLWPRGRADIDVVASDPGATPPPGGVPGKPPGGKPPKRVRIKDAMPGRTVTIVGAVTSRGGFIDAEGRRVTVQDKSGAILVRYPAGVTPAAVGRTIRATGEVGTWFGTVQLEADAKPRVKGGRRVEPSVLRRPPGEADESSLVTVRVAITDVERSDDTWRAEASLSSGARLPIAGLAGSGIAADVLEPGREAVITGIVRRAYPTATDQRFAVAPRSRKDIDLGRLVVAGSPGAGADGLDDADGIDGAGTAAENIDGAIVATLGTLPELDDQVVKVGGRLEQVVDRLLTLHDGTAEGKVRLGEGVVAIEPALRVGEVLNVTGRVRRRGRDSHEVVVDSAADVRRAVSVTRPSTWSLLAGTGNDVLSIGSIPTVGPVTPHATSEAQGVPPALHSLLVLLLLGGAAACLGTVGFLVWRSRRPDTLPPSSSVAARALPKQSPEGDRAAR